MVDAVQVGIDRDHGIEGLRQQGTDNALTHRLTGVKGDVLTHVGQVGCDQSELPGAIVACAAGGQQQFDELVVGVVEAAAEDDVCRQWCGQAQFTFAVGEDMDFCFGVGGAQCCRQALALGGVFAEAGDLPIIHAGGPSVSISSLIR